MSGTQTIASLGPLYLPAKAPLGGKDTAILKERH